MKNARAEKGFDQSYLTTNLSRHHPSYVRVRPFTFGPRINVLEIVCEIDGVQLTVDEFANVPWKVVVPAKKVELLCLLKEKKSRREKPKMLSKCPPI